MKRIEIILLLNLILFYYISGSGNEELLIENPLEGRKIFLNKGCSKCHSTWGIGGKLGPDLSKMEEKKNILKLAGALWNHSPQMIEKMKEMGVERPLISGEEMSKLGSYLYFLDYFGKYGEYFKGKETFYSKGCANCHSAGGKGGRVGKNLDDYSKIGSPIIFIQNMWNNALKMNEKLRKYGIERHKIHKDDIYSILAYIRGVSLNKSNFKIYEKPGNPVKGKNLLKEKRCLECHSVKGNGSLSASDFSKLNLNKNAVEVASSMWNTWPDFIKMLREKSLPYIYFKENELADITAYLYFVKYINFEGNPRKGEIIFEQKKCNVCHSLKKEDNEFPGPNLTETNFISSPSEWASAMWNHAPAMEESVKRIHVPWPKFEGNEMIDLWEFIRSNTVKRK
ncbi:MAG: c-type cytochrome [Acidobacteriota bacterium]